MSDINLSAAFEAAASSDEVVDAILGDAGVDASVIAVLNIAAPLIEAAVCDKIAREIPRATRCLAGVQTPRYDEALNLDGLSYFIATKLDELMDADVAHTTHVARELALSIIEREEAIWDEGYVAGTATDREDFVEDADNPYRGGRHR